MTVLFPRFLDMTSADSLFGANPPNMVSWQLSTIILNHMPPIIFNSFNIGDEIKIIEIFREISDMCGSGGPCVICDGVELLNLLVAQLTDRKAHIVQGPYAFIFCDDPVQESVREIVAFDMRKRHI
jgi:hypothetical protein